MGSPRLMFNSNDDNDDNEQKWRAWPCSEHTGIILRLEADNILKSISQRISRFTVVKRARVPARSLVKMAMDADVDSVRIRALIQWVGAYTWHFLSRKIHGGIMNNLLLHVTRIWYFTFKWFEKYFMYFIPSKHFQNLNMYTKIWFK